MITRSQQDTLTVGGRTFTDMANLKVIGGAPHTEKVLSLFNEVGGTYTPPVGKKFIPLLVYLHGMNTSTAYITIYETGSIHDNTTSAVSNIQKNLFDGRRDFAGSLGDGDKYVELAGEFEIAEGNYFTVYSDTSSSVVRVYGYEVDA